MSEIKHKSLIRGIAFYVKKSHFLQERLKFKEQIVLFKRKTYIHFNFTKFKEEAYEVKKMYFINGIGMLDDA